MLELDLLTFAKATKNDLPDIIAMLRDDILGKERENYNYSTYQDSFDEINDDKNNLIVVVKYDNCNIATCHLTIIPTLSISAKKRMNIESVRVKSDFSCQGVGRWMIEKSIEFAKERGVEIVQLTTNKSRDRAINFYKSLGFQNTHEGLKIEI